MGVFNSNICKRRLSSSVSKINNRELIPTFHYSKIYAKWIQANISSNNIIKDEKLSFLTYNVWFDDFEIDARIDCIIDMINKYTPSIICLQEVTKTFFDKFTKNDLIRKRYYISGNKFSGYGMLMASIFPIEFFEYSLPSRMKRSFIYGDLLTLAGIIRIGTLHLESGCEKDTRKEQLKLILDKVKNIDMNILMGDFNFDNPEENKNIPEDYIDFWLYLNNYKEEGGHTMKPKSKLPPWRPDKVILRVSKQYEYLIPTKIELIGKYPIPKFADYNPNDVGNFIITPSDHYGIITEILIKPSIKEITQHEN